MTEATLPTPPVLTDEQIEESKAKQKRLGQKFTESISAGNRQFGNAKAVIMESETLPAEDLTAIQKVDYAEALATVGRFNEAHALLPDRGYDKISEAIWGDNQPCDCKPFQGFAPVAKDLSKDKIDDEHEIVKVETIIPTTFVRNEVWNLKENKYSKLVACNICGNLTVK